MFAMKSVHLNGPKVTRQQQQKNLLRLIRCGFCLRDDLRNDTVTVQTAADVHMRHFKWNRSCDSLLCSI